MWTLIMKLPYNEVKSFPEVKSQTGLCSLRVSWKRALKKTSLTLFKKFPQAKHASQMTFLQNLLKTLQIVIARN